MSKRGMHKHLDEVVAVGLRRDRSPVPNRRGSARAITRAAAFPRTRNSPLVDLA